jgi:hypothetical protein
MGKKRKTWLAFAAALIGLFTLDDSRAGDAPEPLREPASVARAYLRAVYARDFAEAYRHVSSADQRARNLDQYLRQRGPFNGFALEIAKVLAAMIELETTTTHVTPARMSLTVHYTAPDPEKMAPLLRHWNGYQLNSLSPAERRKVIEAIEAKARDQSMHVTKGEEKLTLVKEADQWRVFLDWARGVAIPFRVILGEMEGALDVTLSHTQIRIQPGELFDLVLKVRNRTENAVVLRIGHLIQPKGLADYLEIVQCGFLLPIKLQPGASQEYSGTYLLRGGIPEGIHQLNLDYDLRALQER